MVKKFKVLDSEVVLDKFFKVLKDKVELPDGKVTDHYTVQTKEAVSVLALTDKNEVVMCEQYRHSIGGVIHDFPAGLIEEGEDLETAARRELEEETGYTAKNLKKLGMMYPVAGFLSMKVHCFLATGLKKEKKQKLDPSEFIDVKLVPLEELTQKIYNNEHNDMISSYAILLYNATEGKK